MEMFCWGLQLHMGFATSKILCKNWKEGKTLIILWRSWLAHQVCILSNNSRFLVLILLYFKPQPCSRLVDSYRTVVYMWLITSEEINKTVNLKLVPFRSNDSCYPVLNCGIFETGCLNGGGQLRAGADRTSKEFLSQVTALYSSLKTRFPENNHLIRKLYSEWLGGPDSDKAIERLHTKYHEVEKMTSALNIKWWPKV